MYKKKALKKDGEPFVGDVDCPVEIFNWGRYVCQIIRFRSMWPPAVAMNRWRANYSDEPVREAVFSETRPILTCDRLKYPVTNFNQEISLGRGGFGNEYGVPRFPPRHEALSG